MAVGNIHRRKSSKDLEDDEVFIPAPFESSSTNPVILAPAPPGNRPLSSHARSTSVSGPSPPIPRSPPLVPLSAASPLNPTFARGHDRNRSVSGPFTPPQPSPLTSVFPSSPNMASPLSPSTSNGIAFPPVLTASKSLPLDPSSPVNPNEPSTSPKHGRRHSRLHSRNLSIFFPRPGSLPTSSIAEDGSQEMDLKNDVEANGAATPGANSITPLGVGFSFGGRTPASSAPNPPSMGSTSSTSTTTKSRKGHHHKHSMSHSFFSFLEPGATGVRSTSTSPVPGDELHAQPTPIPVSPWRPSSTVHPTPSIHDNNDSGGGVPLGPAMGAVGQFLVGAWLWVCGQRIGSLSCTGIGYWVVFDSLGVGISKVFPPWLNSKKDTLRNAREKERAMLKRPYGQKRVLTVFMFAQVVYLLFAAVYVCKETIEHVLLAAGNGHHHHPGENDDEIGIEFPPMMTLFTFCSTIATALLFNNHATLIDVTGNRMPSPFAFLRSLMQSSKQTIYTNTFSPSPLTNMLTNPYSSSPLVFCLAMFGIAVFLPATHHRPADLVLASIIALVTFKVSYRACIILGTVLLQTAPQRGLASGRMEAFLRVMRDVERHPNIIHLPAPHIWQLTPSSLHTNTTTPSIHNHNLKDGESSINDGTLIVSLQLHVREDLGDDEILRLTKWTWERVVRALGTAGGVNKIGNGNGNGCGGGQGDVWKTGLGLGGDVGVEVTVGVVKG
ncbi:hypothetical protein AGABI1DRAFT_121370 [Agaricus bisporus var. burnettii JB137-S8]|uniref:Uncharacterized protein n=1 Tax=Agaricus bisporus var. burnettii (strain JB137-S8 / ATCC MYA-4627 / FGSC 10392) TaxID=597362 RepID=K5WS47_AGABU|nr:uncharacterized protein AGABI1DRAFT_121370 [Agaricus bisporus var. burnettii JB137-S8]EKM78211.1 hypothetical protein AGABI1DRAFT_121370 [Agaricus bisporus var. burnettii JB137-S8]